LGRIDKVEGLGYLICREIEGDAAIVSQDVEYRSFPLFDKCPSNSAVIGERSGVTLPLPGLYSPPPP
jgi:hypothetical protein